MRTRLLLLLIVFAALTGSALAGDAKAVKRPPHAESLSQLIDAAIANNPEVRASEARRQMFQSRILQAGSLEDPMLMLKIQNGIVTDPLNFNKDPMTQKVIGISQLIPFPGKRDLKSQIASHDAESYKWKVEEKKLELKRMVAEAYFQIYATDKALAIVDKNIHILDDLITLAETKYSLGQGAQQDIFKAQVERSKMLETQITLQQQRKSLQANLNSLVYRPTDTPIGSIPDFELKPVTLSAAALSRMAVENRPIFKSLNESIEKGRAGHQLAQRDFYPDFNVSFEYMQRDMGDDMYGLGVTFNLPVRRERRHAMLADSASEITMATEELNGVKNGIDSGISDLLAQLERRKKLVELYRYGIIPQASHALESATIAYRVNKADYLTLQDSQVTLFNYERDLYDSLADYQMKLAQLEALVGTELR